MKTVGHWKRFRPRLRGKLSDTTVYEPDSLYAYARSEVGQYMQATRSRRFKPDNPLSHTARAVAKLRSRDPQTPEQLLALLILQTPGATRAQTEMDNNHGGYKNRQARLYELIDFNDTFVDTVMALPEDELSEFPYRLKREMDWFCDHLGVPNFKPEQFDAIVHGLSREIAVFYAAKDAGLIARMTSRVQDAKGIDLIITDPATKRTISIDVKTRASFRWRLVDLQRRGRVDEDRRMQCELAGYCTVKSRKNDDVDTLLFRVATNRLGAIKDFRFVDPEPVRKLLHEALNHHGRYTIH